MKYKRTILCFIFGNGYEKLHEIAEKDPETEYLMVTDNDNLASDTWTVVIDHSYDGKPVFERCFSVRYNVFKYAHSDICMTVDGSVEIKKTPIALFDKFEQENYDISLIPHPLRDTFKPEYETWITTRKYPIIQAKKFFDLIHRSGYDESYRGLFELGFSIKRRSKIINDIDSLVFSFLKYLSAPGEFERLDQTVFSFVLNKYFDFIKLLPMSAQIYHNNPYMQLKQHNSDRDFNYINYNLSRPDVKYVFNRPVECFYLTPDGIKRPCMNKEFVR